MKLPLPLAYWRSRREQRGSYSLSLDQWAEMLKFGGHTYQVMPQQTLLGTEEKVEQSFAGYVNGFYKRNGVVFACMLARMMLFSEARFRFRRVRDGRPGELFGSSALRLLEEPWAGASTGDLLARSIQDADLGGNSFWTRTADTMVRLRPDWVTIVSGSSDPNANHWAIDSELVGYVYEPGGRGSGADPVFLRPETVAHFAPIPDPAFRHRGMSWLEPVVQEILGDSAASYHKLHYFQNGATGNMVVSLSDRIGADTFDRWIKTFEGKNQDFVDAYRTLYLAGGASVTKVGDDLKQVDFKVVQGHGETRIAAAAGVPPVVVGLSEGLEAATYSNYAQARRRFADMTIRPLWRNFADSISRIIDVPGGAELWYDDRDIPALQEDLKDAAEIQNREADTITRLLREGYTPESVIAAVENANWSLLKHTGLISVQLHDPTKKPEPPPPAAGNGAGPPVLVPAPEGED